MEWVETTGRTVEEAKDAALDELGVHEDDAEFEVIEEPKTGLFGRLRGEARVRARVRPTKPRPKDDRRERRRSRDRREPARSGNGGGGNGGGGNNRDGGAAVTATAATSDDKPAGRATTTGGRTPRKREAAPAAARDGGTVTSELTLPEQAELAADFLRGLLEKLGTDAEVTVSEVDDDTVEVNVDGGELGLLIGPRGQTLAALQELTRTVVQRRTGGRDGWVMVDVSGYRKKRREALQKFAQHVAEQVKSSGNATALEPMSAADRKIVHDTINDIDGVSTSSEGEDARRHVVIRPA